MDLSSMMPVKCCETSERRERDRRKRTNSLKNFVAFYGSAHAQEVYNKT